MLGFRTVDYLWYRVLDVHDGWADLPTDQTYVVASTRFRIGGPRAYDAGCKV